MSVVATAPEAPGRLGVPVSSIDVLRYIENLGAWRDRRRRELDAIDEAAMASPDQAELTGDVTLSMTLWKTVADRFDLLAETWDGGRVGPVELERLGTLIWGRLDPAVGTAGPVTVSLPEACRLSDALAASLRNRLALDPLDADVGMRIRQLRATLERLRELLAGVPPGPLLDGATALTDRLGGRLAALAASARRGGDASGPLAPLEAECALAERDLIVGAARRRNDARAAARAKALQATLRAQTLAVRDLEARAVAGVSPAPRLAVPNVDALGPIPETSPEVDAYLVRLDRVSRALAMAQDAYAAALARLEELNGRLGAYRAKAASTGLAGDLLVAEADRAAQAALDAHPVDLVRAEALVDVHRAAVSALRAEGQGPA